MTFVCVPLRGRKEEENGAHACVVVPVRDGGTWRVGCGSGGSRRLGCRKASNAAPSQSCLVAGGNHQHSQCLVPSWTRCQFMQSQSCWVCILRFPWQPPIASLHWVPRLQHFVPAQAGTEASAFCFVRGIVIAQTSLFVMKIYAAVSDAYCELYFLMITFYWIMLYFCCLSGRNLLCGHPLATFEGSLAIYPSPLSLFPPPHHPAFSFCCA